MDNEAGIFSLTFDKSGTRLITTEADKTVKMYKEDDTAVFIIYSINNQFCNFLKVDSKKISTFFSLKKHIQSTGDRKLLSEGNTKIGIIVDNFKIELFFNFLNRENKKDDF